MLTYTLRRVLISIPTLLFIAFVIFMLLEFAPGDPMASMPLTIPPEVRQEMRLALGLGEPWYVRFPLWLRQFFIVEPQYWIDGAFGTNFADGAQRIISFQSRSPVFDTIAQRMPQTLWVVGMSYVVGVLIALPIGIISAYRQYSVFDQAGTFVSMIGFSVPPFFSGVLLIVIFSVQLKWLPSIYDTTHVVTNWDSFMVQLRQMIMPCPHRPRKRYDRKRCCHETRAAQFYDPCCDGHCAWHPQHLWRGDHHRTNLQGERSGPIADHRPTRV